MEPKRKINRLTEYDYAQSGAYFITICTHGRQKILWDSNTFTEVEDVGASIARPQHPPALSEAGKIVEQCIFEIPTHYPHISVEKYAVMPNHVHLLLLVQNGQGGPYKKQRPAAAVCWPLCMERTRRTQQSAWVNPACDRYLTA